MWEDCKSGSKWVIVNRCYFPGDLPENVGRPSAPESNEVDLFLLYILYVFFNFLDVVDLFLEYILCLKFGGWHLVDQTS